MQVSHLIRPGSPRITATHARTLWERLRGLLGRKEPFPGTGLLLERVRSIHTIGMDYPIDVVFLDDSMQVIRVYHCVPPGTLCVRAPDAMHALELRSGDALRFGVTPGDTFLVAASP